MHENPFCGDRCRFRRAAVRRHRAGAGRKDDRTQAVALGAGLASTAEGAGGMGRRGREGFRRYHSLQGLPGAAAWQGFRPLRHGARRHRRPHLHQSRLSARPLPDHRRRRIAVPDFERQGRLDGVGRLVSQIRRQGDEGRQILSRLHPCGERAAHLQQEGRGARRHQGDEDPSRRCDLGNDGDSARRHQRAVVGAGSARHHRAPRRRRRIRSRGARWFCSASTK